MRIFKLTLQFKVILTQRLDLGDAEDRDGKTMDFLRMLARNLLENVQQLVKVLKDVHLLTSQMVRRTSLIVFSLVTAM